MTHHLSIRTVAKSAYLSVALALTVIVSLPAATPLIGTAAAADCTPDTSQPGVRKPVGSDAAAFTYNCDGKWYSKYYVYDPATGGTTLREQPTYTYSAAAGGYTYPTYVWDAPSGTYVTYTKTVATPPAGAVTVGAPAPATPAPSSGGGGNSISNTGSGSNNTINNNGGATNGSSINGTGPNSNNTVNGSNNNNVNSTNNTGANMNNTITATANTGNALTLSNTTAGGARSGNAQDIANVVNMLQSSSNALGGDAVTFVANIDGDVNGDLFFDPAAMGNVQPASVTGPQTGNKDITLNNSLDASINNNINLAANSGNAGVSNNTTGGDATSGTATTIANVVNMINSAVSSGKSFLGTININGNLNGDILVPDNFVDQLLAANTPTVTVTNTGPNSNNAINTTGSDSTTVNNNNNLGINNNVNQNAASGTANVSNNTKAGSAKSGSADTSITAFNLTGSQVVGKNAILVFVNVQGSWVGLIVNAPPGATAAALGGGVTQNNTVANTDTTVNNNTRHRINNNITTNAKSGDASVNGNTNGGDATTGDAQSAVNLANIENSSLGLSDWFGILFINVFGSWHGSFGVNTSAGDPIASASGSNVTGTSNGAPAGAVGTPGSTFFNFIPNNGQTGFKATSNTSQTAPSAASVTTPTKAVNAVLAASTVKSAKAPTPSLDSKPDNFATKAAVIAGLTAALIIGDALYTRRKSTHRS